MTASNLRLRLFDRAEAMDLTARLPSLSELSEDRVDEIRGGGAFSAAEFERLCRTLAVDPVVMYRGEESAPNRIPARFRSAFSTTDAPDGRDIRLLALAMEQSRILAHLAEQLGQTIRLATHRDVRAPSGVGETWREGYDMGEEARQLLCPAPGPIHDLEAQIRKLGVHVAHVTFVTSDVDAASIWDPKVVPIILLNKTSGPYEHPGARRAMLAHELCHLLHDAGESDLTTVVSWGTEGRGNYSEILEVRARAFAPAFLAPRDQTKQWLAEQPKSIQRDSRRTVEALAKHWGLSFEGAAWHAKNCKILGAKEAASLASKPSQQRIDYALFDVPPAWVPPSMVHSELPKKAAELWDGAAAEMVFEALDEGHLTLGRARELLTWG